MSTLQSTSVGNGTNGSKGLFLDSLEIKGFRAFEHLSIEKLGRVNLIVGKNSVGKTCLLEAIRLYAERGSPQSLWQILIERDEEYDRRERFVSSRLPPENNAFDVPFVQIHNLFHGRNENYILGGSIKIGPVQREQDTLTVESGLLVEEREEIGGKTLRLFNQLQQPPLFDDTSADAVPGVSVHFGSEPEQIYSLLRERFVRPRLDTRLNLAKLRTIYVGVSGLLSLQIDQYWDHIKLRDTKRKVLEALQIISPEIEDIDIFGNPERTRERISKVKLSSSPEPVPLRSMGDGLNRVFSLMVALVNASNGLLIVDEVESGLHFSVQKSLWRLIFELAEQLNVQVFATTHSWDCIKAFQEAALESENEDGMLIRLQRRNGEITPVIFDEHDLSIVTREQIEVR